MFYPLEIFIGLRYTRPKRNNRFISFISVSAMLGIALGVATLITVIAVMNGFEQELRQRILGMIAHLTITGREGPVANWKGTADSISHFGITSAPFIEEQGMIVQGNIVTGITVRGILPEYETAVSTIGTKMRLGEITNLTPGSFSILLGIDLARRLGVNPGDKITLITPQAMVTPLGLLPRLKRFTVAGIFQIGMYEYDSALALTHLNDAGRLFRLDLDTVSGLRLALNNLYDAPGIARRIRPGIPNYRVEDWTMSHASFFQAVHTEQSVMFIILTLIVAVAAFNIMAMLMMVVTDKEADIAILRTMGLSPRRIMNIFIVQGFFLGIIGSTLGLIGGVTLAIHISAVVQSLENFFGARLFSPDIYYITDLPSELRIADVILISITALCLCLIATLYPAGRAARIQPVTALARRT